MVVDEYTLLAVNCHTETSDTVVNLWRLPAKCNWYFSKFKKLDLVK